MPKLLSAAILATLLLRALTSPGAAQIFAHDDAAAYTALNTGTNLGFGFQPWIVTNNNNNSSTFAGTFIGGSGTAIDTSGKSWGFYANGAGAPFMVGYRPFTNALPVNTVFKVKLKNDSINTSNPGYIGFALGNNNITNDIGINDLTFQSTDNRFAFYFQGGASDYIIHDGNGLSDSLIPFTFGGLSLEFVLIDADHYRLTVKSADGGTTIASYPIAPLGGNNGDPVSTFAGYVFQNDSFNNGYFNQLDISSISLVPPSIVNIQPTNNSIFVDPATNKLTFEVDAGFAFVSKFGVTLTLNGVVQSNLTFNTASPTAQLLVTNSSFLQSNVLYTAQITALDTNGNRTTATFTFNTWVANLLYVEAEDYNFSAGGFIGNPFPNAYVDIGGATNGVDVFKPSPNDGGGNTYRPQDNLLIDLDAPGISADVDHNGFVSQGYSDYNLSFVEFGEWENYTRQFGSGGEYNVYARMASLSGNPVMEFDHLANATATSSNQPLAALGTFVCPADTGGSQKYTFVPLKDFFSNPVMIRLTNTAATTFRGTRIGGSYNFNYLIFVPATNTAVLRPYISAGFPFSGANVGLEQTISFTIANRQTAVNPGSIQLFLNSNNITSSLTFSNNAAGTVVKYIPPNLLTPNSTNTLSAVYTDSAAVTQTNTWQFTVNNATIVSVPPAYAQPLGSFTTRGFSIRINKADDNAPDYDFPTTLARAEAQLSGSIINTNNGQPYPNLAAGPNGDGSFADTNVINFDINAQSTGTFPGDTAFPYIPASGTNNFIAMEALTYLQLTNGTYAFAVRSDDGFQYTVGPTPANTNLALSIFDGGRGNDTPTVFYFTVTTNGLYPMRLLYFQGKFGGNVELYAFDKTTGNPVLINDPNTSTAIKAFQVPNLANAVTISGTAHSGNTTTFNFQTQSGRTHFVEYKNNLLDVNWTALQTVAGNGSVTNITDSTASGGRRFYRVRSQ